MFTMHHPLPVHEPLLPCPSCETAMLCRTNMAERRENAVTVLLCPSCGIYHSIDITSSKQALFASPVLA